MDDQTSMLDTSVPPEQEKMLSVERVNEIVKGAKAQAAEKARREAETLYQQELSTLKQQQASMGGMQQQVPEDVYAQLKEKLMGEINQEREQMQQQALQAQHQTEMTNLANKYVEKMSLGKTLYDDFDAITKDFDPSAFPEVTFLAAHMENTPDIMYELSQNPGKLADVHTLAQRDPKMAQVYLNRMVDSMNKNKKALQENENLRTNPPLSMAKPSKPAGVDSGKMGLADFKRMYKG